MQSHPSDPSSGEAAPRRSLFSGSWFWPLLSCFLLTALLAARFITDLDLGFHLRGGQWILQNHWVPSKDAYTYTVPDHQYLDIHWLYQVLLYLVYLVGGYSLLTLCNIFLITAAFALAWIRLRENGVPAWMGVLLMGAAAWVCEIRFQVRPEIISWVLLGMMLWVLEERAGKRKDLLFLLPLIQIIWANVEGLFALGWGVMAVFLVSSVIHDRRIDWKMLRWSCLALTACFLNPYFLQGVAYPYSNWKILNSELFRPNIRELLSPWNLSQNSPIPEGPLFIYKLFCFFFLFLLLATFKRRKAHELFLAAAFLFLSAAANRNIPLFTLACLPIAAACWKDLDWVWLRKFQDKFLSGPWAARIFTVLVLGFGLRVVTGAYYVDGHRYERFGLGVSEESQPVRAAEFLVKNRLDGRILNTLNSGGWLDWKGPQKVFMDGRLEVIGDALFAEYLLSQKTGGLDPLAKKYGVDILFINPSLFTHWIADLPNNRNWRLVYLDGFTAIYLRNGYAPWVPEMEDARFLEESGVPADILGQTPELLGIPATPAWQTYLEGFYRRASMPTGIFWAGSFLLLEGRLRAGEAYLLEAIRRSGGRYGDLYYSLGLLYNSTQRYNEARLCMQRVLEDNPVNSVALQVLQSLPGQ